MSAGYGYILWSCVKGLLTKHSDRSTNRAADDAYLSHDLSISLPVHTWKSDGKMIASGPRLCTGAAVALRDLVSRTELNGLAGRVLKIDSQTGRYGVRLTSASGGLLIAVKRCNLEPLHLPLEEGVVSSATSVLDLPADILERHLCRHMSVRSLVRFSSTCVLLRSTCATADDDDSICEPLAHPYLAPYHERERGSGLGAYRHAVQLRESWHAGPDRRCRSTTLASFRPALTIIPTLTFLPPRPRLRPGRARTVTSRLVRAQRT